MNKLLLLESPEAPILREVIYKLGEISGFRLYNILIDLSYKHQTYEEKKIK